MNSYASNYARVAEQADAPDLKFGVRKNVRVQVPSRVLSDTTLKPTPQKVDRNVAIVVSDNFHTLARQLLFRS